MILINCGKGVCKWVIYVSHEFCWNLLSFFHEKMPFVAFSILKHCAEPLYETLLTDVLSEEKEMNREEILNAAESIMSTAGFQISKRCTARPSCFCLTARRDDDLIFIKVPSNLGNVSLRGSLELQTISSCFEASPLFVGDRARERQLEDDTVYTRYDIYAITPKTLEDVVLRGMLPLIEAGPGGYYVRLDGDAIRQRRQKLGLSVGKLAERLKISRRTLYGYEKGMAKASVSAAYSLEWVLGIPVVQPIDIFQPAPPNSGFFAAARRIIKNQFLQRVLKMLARCHFTVAATGKAPFDFIAQSTKDRVNIIGGVSQKNEKNLDQRAEEIVSVSEVIRAQPVFITDGKLIPYNNIPLIHPEELEEIRLPEDLISKL